MVITTMTRATVTGVVGLVIGSRDTTTLPSANVATMLKELGVAVPKEQWFVGTVSRRKLYRASSFGCVVP